MNVESDLFLFAVLIFNGFQFCFKMSCIFIGSTKFWTLVSRLQAVMHSQNVTSYTLNFVRILHGVPLPLTQNLELVW
jgi:hypothetical protein